jgi:hypothetical protein
VRFIARLRPTDYAAGGFVALAAGFAALDVFTNVAYAWTPNLGASSLEIAATIAIVDRIVRREARRRAQPLTLSALNALGRELVHLVDGLEYDVALARAATVDDPAPMPTGRRARDVFEDALEVVGGRRRAASDELEELRVANLTEDISRALAIIERRLAVDRDALAPSLAAELEELAVTLTRRGPAGGSPGLQAYRLARAVTNALGRIVTAADPQIQRFVADYIDEPRRQRADEFAANPLSPILSGGSD